MVKLKVVEQDPARDPATYLTNLHGQRCFVFFVNVKFPTKYSYFGKEAIKYS